MSKTTRAASKSAVPTLSPEEGQLFVEQLRQARYAALADAEGFQQMCFAIEALGARLSGSKIGLGSYKNALGKLAKKSALLPASGEAERPIKSFNAQFLAIREARNDAMHSGAYARHVTTDAVTLCMILEDALMSEGTSLQEIQRKTVGDFMVSTPVTIQPWQTIEQARRIMLLNSFSYLPMWHQEQWHLIADISIAKYLRPHWPARNRLTQSLAMAIGQGLIALNAKVIDRKRLVSEILEAPNHPGLWLITQPGYPPEHLAGVLSPFELM